MQFYRLDRHVINDLNREKIVGIFYEKELQKANERIEKELRIEKVFKTKGNKLYVKWKGCNTFFLVRLIKMTYYKK